MLEGFHCHSIASRFRLSEFFVIPAARLVLMGMPVRDPIRVLLAIRMSVAIPEMRMRSGASIVSMPNPGSLQEAVARTGIRVLSYCLMRNHWNLVCGLRK